MSIDRISIGLLGRGNAVERPAVAGSVREAPGYPVTGSDEVVHGGGEVGEGGEEGGPEGAVGFPAILDEGIVVDVAMATKLSTVSGLCWLSMAR